MTSLHILWFLFDLIKVLNYIGDKVEHSILKENEKFHVRNNQFLLQAIKFYRRVKLVRKLPHELFSFILWFIVKEK